MNDLLDIGLQTPDSVNTGKNPALNPADEYVKTLLDALGTIESEYHHRKYAMKHTLKENFATTAVLQRWETLTANTLGLDVDTAYSGMGAKVNGNAFRVSVGLYGLFIEYNDHLAVTQFADFISFYTAEMSRNSAETYDLIARDAMRNQGTKRSSANLNSDALDLITAADVFDAADIRAIAKIMSSYTTLKPNSALLTDPSKIYADYLNTANYVSHDSRIRGINGKNYIAFVSRDAYDFVMFDPWVADVTYMNKASGVNAGTLNPHANGLQDLNYFGVQFCIVPNAKVEKNASNVEIEFAIIIGHQHAVETSFAYGFQLITHAFGSAGANDQLNRYATMGWKGYFGFNVLDARATQVYVYAKSTASYAIGSAA